MSDTSFEQVTADRSALAAAAAVMNSVHSIQGLPKSARTALQSGEANLIAAEASAAAWLKANPPAPPSPYSSGFTIPASLPGYTRNFTDFKNGIDPSFWTDPYDGTPGGTPGRFLASHMKVVDGLLTAETYQDPAADIPGQNNWAGAGIQTITRWPVGTIMYAVVRKDDYANLFDILLAMGGEWPPEIDFMETATIDTDTITVHYGAGNETLPQVHVSGLDLSKWFMRKLVWTSSSIVVTQYAVDGSSIPISNQGNPATNPSDPHSLVQPQFFSFQSQTEGNTVLPNDPNVTAENPVKFQLEQFAAFTPA